MAAKTAQEGRVSRRTGFCGFLLCAAPSIERFAGPAHKKEIFDAIAARLTRHGLVNGADHG
jgi:hypothetical protein